jgi:glutaconate CoA-transferase subunit B
VDELGNVNSTCIGDPARPKVALVGPIFLPEHMAVFGREYLMMPHHETRSFVKKVDHVTGVGFPGGREGRKRLGLPGGGPCAVYTPKCVFAFDARGKIFVESIHPGVTADELRQSTGFELGDLSNVPETPAPTKEELELLRGKVDPKAILLPR